MDREKVLGYMFSQCSRNYKKAINQALETYNLTTVQCGVIRILKHIKSATQAEIADLYSSDRATMGTVIQKLMDKGYLKKELSTDDKRAYVVSLTPKAMEIAEEIEKISNDIEQKALQGLKQKEIDQFYKVLAHINKNLN